jgi:TRAP-type C4-dicarboxylate transport system permease small subunit
VISAFRVGFERVLIAIVIFLLTAITVIVLMGVTYRKLDIPLVWYDEVASIALAWLTYYGAALAALKRAHIGFPGLINAMPPHIRIPFVLLGEVIIIGFFAVLAWNGYQVLQILEGDTMISLPWVATQITQSVIPVGAVLFIVAQLLSLPALLEQARGHGVIDAEKAEMENELKKAMQQ